MANRKPVAGDVYASGFDKTATIEGDILETTSLFDADGDIVRLNFVNGQRIAKSADPDNPAFTVIKGTYGTLTINSNGGYIYELDQDNAAVQALGPGEAMTERVTFKISDGKGATDFGVLNIVVDIPDRGSFVVDFEDAGSDFPETYKGFEWGAWRDGDEMNLGVEANGNHYISAGVFTSPIYSVDGHDFIINDMVVSNFNALYDNVLTITGYRDSNDVATLEILITADSLETGQHIDLSGFGLIDYIFMDYEAVGYDGDGSDYPSLKFDDFSIIA